MMDSQWNQAHANCSHSIKRQIWTLIILARASQSQALNGLFSNWKFTSTLIIKLWWTTRQLYGLWWLWSMTDKTVYLSCIYWLCLLSRNNYATFQEIRTKTITVQASNNRGDSKKAKLFITLKRGPDFFENMKKFNEIREENEKTASKLQEESKETPQWVPLFSATIAS